jgi:hypothetical protein
VAVEILLLFEDRSSSVETVDGSESPISILHERVDVFRWLSWIYSFEVTVRVRCGERKSPHCAMTQQRPTLVAVPSSAVV